MTEQQWNAVDTYFDGLFSPPDPVLDATLQATLDADMIPMNVAPNQGKLLHILALAVRARRILEVGTLAGYSTIWLARALGPGGQVITLEADPGHAAVARANIAHAGLSDAVEVREGRALDTLPQIASEGGAPFDLVFIDADKASNAEYVAWALQLSRPGSMIIVDNVVRGGAVIDATSADPSVQGVRRFADFVANEPRLVATALQTVGSKGYDGLAVMIVAG